MSKVKIPKDPGPWRCQFCLRESMAKRWRKNRCPFCKREYDAQFAQDSEE